MDSVRVYAGGPSIRTSTLIKEVRKSQSENLTLFGINNFLIVSLQSDGTDFKPSVKAIWKAGKMFMHEYYVVPLLFIVD